MRAPQECLFLNVLMSGCLNKRKAKDRLLRRKGPLPTKTQRSGNKLEEQETGRVQGNQPICKAWVPVPPPVWMYRVGHLTGTGFE